MVTGNNGIFGKAKFASKKYKESAKNEEDQLGEVVKMADELLSEESKLPDNAKGVEAGTRVKTPSTWFKITPSYVQTKDGSIVKIKAKTASVIAVADGENNIIPVPEGFYYVGGTKSSGVVISDNKDDQNKYKGQADVPAGVEYDTTTGIVNNYILKGNQFVWIPVDETYAKKDWGYNNDSWDSLTPSGEYKLVTKYGGFYVGRYEAGVGDVKLPNVDFSAQNTASGWQNRDFSLNSNTLTSGKISEKAGEIPYYHSDFKTAQILSQNMYQTDSVQSGLVTGTMWDFIMKFIISSNNNNDDSIVKSNSSWGNYKNTGSIVKYTAGQGRYAGVNSSNGAMTSAFVTSDASYHYGIRTTASSEGVKKNNLYDIAGNLWEWSEESASIGRYMLRGGSFYDAFTGYPACSRAYGAASDTRTRFGFRPALYIM